jgi:hypothetical protein
MVMPAAVADTLTQVAKTPVEGVQWCPGCNHTRTLDHFTPLRIGIPYYRPYCNYCAPLSPHRRLGWFHPLIRTIWTSLCNLADRLQTVFEPKKGRFGAESVESRAEWSVNPATGVTTFVRLGDGLLIDMNSPDVLRLLAFLQSYEGTLKQQGEVTAVNRKEIRHRKSVPTSAGSYEPGASVQAVLEPIQQSELQETNRFQSVGE